MKCLFPGMRRACASRHLIEMWFVEVRQNHPKWTISCKDQVSKQGGVHNDLIVVLNQSNRVGRPCRVTLVVLCQPRWGTGLMRGPVRGAGLVRGCGGRPPTNDRL